MPWLLERADKAIEEAAALRAERAELHALWSERAQSQLGNFAGPPDSSAGRLASIDDRAPAPCCVLVMNGIDAPCWLADNSTGAGPALIAPDIAATLAGLGTPPLVT
jgi:hypothetical protein